MGVFGDAEAANLIYLGLHALQHRGQEGCGIVTHNQGNKKGDIKSDTRSDINGGESRFEVHKAFGLVADSVTHDVIAKLTGDSGIGHVRYSTQGGRLVQNIQPFFFRTSIGPIAIAHNGNLTNAAKIRQDLESSGSIFQSTSDTEVFVHLIARSRAATLRERIAEVMPMVNGAYSLVILAEEALFAVRDPFGFRPLVLGKRGEATVVASETCALDLIDADYLREVEPGEVVEISATGMKSFSPIPKKSSAFCAFEPIYFARPDSKIFGDEIYTMRRQMGVVLAKEAPAVADVVIAIPDSGVPMAIGYAAASGIPLELGLVRNHYVGRTFIEPTQAIRDFGVKLKLNPSRAVLAGKRVVVVDDSLVRGTTSAKILRMLRAAGAVEIHFRIGSPPITHSCFYGVDTPRRRQLLAAQKNVDQIREIIGADSLAFLSIEGLKSALGPARSGSYCFACFNGNYQENIHQDVVGQPTDGKGPGLRSGLGSR